jgi:hypothetical protein
MKKEEPMTERQRSELLNRLVTQQVNSLAGVHRYRLPISRCACLEPTVKWCPRHGAPRKPLSA